MLVQQRREDLRLEIGMRDGDHSDPFLLTDRSMNPQFREFGEAIQQPVGEFPFVRPDFRHAAFEEVRQPGFQTDQPRRVVIARLVLVGQR